MAKNLFSKRKVGMIAASTDRQFSAVGLGLAKEQVMEHLNAGMSASIGSSNVGKFVYSPESMDLNDLDNVTATLEEVATLVGRTFSAEQAELGAKGEMKGKEYQINRPDFIRDMVTMAAAIGSNPRGVMSRQLSVESLRNQPRTAVIDMPPGPGDYFFSMPEDIRLGLEAYDEKNNKDAIAFSIVWNANFRQSPWAEAFFPTVVLTPDQLGLSFTVPVVEVQPELRRDVSGDPSDFRRRNVIRAMVDPSILEDNITDAVPIVRAQSADKFAPAALIAPHTVMIAGEAVQTAPLLFGKEIDYLAISQTEALLATGAMDTSDSLDPAIRMRNVYAQIGNKAVKFNVYGSNGTTFNYSPQDEYRKMILTHTFRALMIDKNTKAVDGSNLPGLDVVYSDNLTVRLQADVNGSIVLEGNGRISASGLSVVSVTNEDGQKLAEGDAAYDAVVAAIEAATTRMLSYDVELRRTNTNMRQRGQLLNTNYFTQIHAVPLRAPITVKRPQNQGDQNDGSDIATLLQTTYARASNAAVAEFFRHADFLRTFVGSVDDLEGRHPDTLGVARYFVRPFFDELELRIQDVLQTQSSGNKTRDVMEAICYTLRDQVYRGYVKSEFKVGTDALRGPTSEPPTVIIGVPPYLRQYLQIFGDVRIFGENFPYRIVESWHPLHKDKIVWSFGFFDGGDGQANPLHYGAMAVRPEITSVLSLPRNGGYSKELTVCPSYLHISNLPIVGILHVTGLEALANERVAIPVDILNSPLLTQEAP